MVQVDLYRRVADDQIATNDVALDTRSHIEAIRIAGDRVVLDDIVIRAATFNTDAEVVALDRIAISTEPVPTEPVAAGAAEHSYAAAGSDGISVAHRNVATDLVVGSAADENAGEAIGGYGHAGYCDAGAVVQEDARSAKSLNQARAVDADAPAGLRFYVNAILGESWRTSSTGSLCVGLSCHGKAVQLQCHMRSRNGNAGGASDSAGNIVHQLAVFRDGKCGGNSPTDVGCVGIINDHE